MKKSLIVFSVVLLLISLSFVSAEITGDATTTRGEFDTVKKSVSSADSTSTGTLGTRVDRVSFATKRADSVNLDRWTKVVAKDGGFCYVPKARATFSLFSRQ